MPVAEISVKLKNGGYIYTCKSISDSAIKSCFEILGKYPNAKLNLTSDENMLFSDVKLKVEDGTLYEYFFKGIHSEGIILGADLFTQILEYKETSIENIITSLNPNANLEVMNLLQDVSKFLISDDEKNKNLSLLFRNAGSPVNNAVARINKLNSVQIVTDLKDDLICTANGCVSTHSSDIQNTVESNTLSPSTEFNNIGNCTIPVSTSTTVSNVGSPKIRNGNTVDSRRSSHQSFNSDMPNLITAKFDDIRHNISEVKENINDIKNQTKYSDPNITATLIPEHTYELKNSLTEISTELDNLGKHAEEHKHINIHKISSSVKIPHSRALLQTRGIINNTGKVQNKLRPKLQN